MSTFYSTSNNQRDGSPSLCLGDPGNAPYPDSSIPANMVYLSYPSSGPFSAALADNSQNFGNATLPLGSSIGNVNMLASGLGEQAYTDLKDGRSEMLLMRTVGNSINGSDDLLPSNDPQMNLRSQFGCINGQNLSLQHSNVSTMQNQGLSLSLSTQIPVPSFQYHATSSEISFVEPQQPASANSGPHREGPGNKNVHQNITSYALSTATNSLPNSKYLKAAQEILDEVVNVRTVLKQKGEKSHNSAGVSACKDTSGGSKSEGMNPQESTDNSINELSPSERQDLQNKVTKLLAMLDEVDRRYKQYYHQMQIIVSSFDAIAGFGAAKPYTALALQTISRHFRCLRDAISGQIQSTRTSLGEQDSSTSKSGLSRLRYIDQQLRQQRAMQQFGMMQQHAWRPQRGLPESSVSILRAWLFEHFLHPYPKDSEKLMLARQTGLTRSQVSNWFINARVRLWKPMIEDMYKEETGDVEIDSNSSSDPPNDKEDTRSSKDHEDLQSPITERCQTSPYPESARSNIIQSADIAPSVSGFQNGTTNDVYMNMKVSDERAVENSTFIQDALTHPDGAGRFMTYQMTELGPYASNGVSLTLGLQHCEGGLSIPDNQQNFLAVNGGDIYGAAAPVQTDTADFDYAGDRRHRFASSHLLHDFVA